MTDIQRSEIKRWLRGLLSPHNAMSLFVGIILFMKMSFHTGTIIYLGYKGVVDSVVANTANFHQLDKKESAFEIRMYVDSCMQDIRDTRQEKSIDKIEKFLAKQP